MTDPGVEFVIAAYSITLVILGIYSLTLHRKIKVHSDRLVESEELPAPELPEVAHV